MIILDEIQSCLRVLLSLKAFCEEAPQYYIVAAGSLLEVTVNREKYSFPVGKVNELSMYPMDFVVQIAGEVVPVEVKKGKRTKSASLNMFLKK